MMNTVFETLLSNPIYLGIAAILAVFLLIGIVKRVIRMIATAGLILLGFVAFLIITGRPLPTSTDELKESIDKAKSAAISTVKEEIAKELKDQTNF